MIHGFVVYGERNSGTNYLETILTGESYHLSHNSSAFNMPIFNGTSQSKNKKNIDNPYGSKHFFGYNDEYIKSRGLNVLFIGIVRNPYDWIMACNKSKHHIPEENQDIKSFLTNEWFSIISDKKSKIYKQEKMDDRDFDTGLRYKNIFALRSKKLRYLYETMPTIAKNYELIKYEDLCKNPLLILQSWSDKYNLEINKNFIQPIKKDPYKIEPEIKKIIDDNIDWGIENEIGYFRK